MDPGLTLVAIGLSLGLVFIGQFVGARLPSLRRPGLGTRPVDVDNA